MRGETRSVTLPLLLHAENLSRVSNLGDQHEQALSPNCSSKARLMSDPEDFMENMYYKDPSEDLPVSFSLSRRATSTHELMESMSERLKRHLDPLDETWRAMQQAEQPTLSNFTLGYMQAFEKLSEAIYFYECNFPDNDPVDYQVGYWYACLKILGLDTKGLAL